MSTTLELEVDMNAAAGESGDWYERLLFGVGFFTLLMDVATALYEPPHGVVFEHHRLAYYLALAGILIAGLAEVCAAFWLKARPRHGGKLTRAVLCASVVPLVGVAALGGFSMLMKI